MTNKKHKGTEKDECYNKVKDQYQKKGAWPSAYASGQIVKCRKKNGMKIKISKKGQNLRSSINMLKKKKM